MADQDQTTIRAMMESLRAAVSARDIEKVLVHYAPDVTTFDLVEPLMNRGRDAVKKRLQQWFSSFRENIGYEQRGEELSIAGDVAFGHHFTHVHGTNVSGVAIDMWFRETLGYRKTGGTWQIVHQHSSVPLDMTTMKGMLDLKPPAG